MPVSINETFNADYDSFTAFTSKVAVYHEEAQVPSHLAYAADLALEELVTNIVKYGNTEGNVITISLSYDGEMLEIKIVDSGSEFDPTTAQAPDLNLPLEERPIGQIGLSMVRNMFDRFEYHRADGKNIIELGIVNKKK